MFVVKVKEGGKKEEIARGLRGRERDWAGGFFEKSGGIVVGRKDGRS